MSPFTLRKFQPSATFNGNAASKLQDVGIGKEPILLVAGVEVLVVETVVVVGTADVIELPLPGVRFWQEAIRRQ